MSGYYWLALFFFALGLMSKPMLVTLPFVMLLLDWWPLGRVSSVECRVPGAPAPDFRPFDFGKNSILCAERNFVRGDIHGAAKRRCGR